MKLKTLIIDDEPIALEKLRNYVGKVPFLELAGACLNGIEAAEIISREKIDVIFTDINMPDMNGMEFISTLSCPPLVVFTTAYSDYAVESYRLSAIDYLLKPYGFTDFQRAANKALETYRLRSEQTHRQPEEYASATTNKSIFIKVDYRYIRVNFSDILYIKGYGEYLQIYVSGTTSPLMTLSSFSSMNKHLPANFLQVHRSYVVNMNVVQSISKNRIIINSDTYIPVGDSYKDAFLSYLSSHSIGAAQKK